MTVCRRLGEQLFIRYGSGKMNKSWMVNFGFVMPANPAERIEIDLEPDGKKTHDLPRVLQLLSRSVLL